MGQRHWTWVGVAVLPVSINSMFSAAAQVFERKPLLSCSTHSWDCVPWSLLSGLGAGTDADAVVVVPVVQKVGGGVGGELQGEGGEGSDGEEVVEPDAPLCSFRCLRSLSLLFDLLTWPTGLKSLSTSDASGLANLQPLSWSMSVHFVRTM